MRNNHLSESASMKRPADETDHHPDPDQQPTSKRQRIEPRGPTETAGGEEKPPVDRTVRH